MCVYIYIYIYLSLFIYTYTCVYIYIYIYIFQTIVTRPADFTEVVGWMLGGMFQWMFILARSV